MEILLNHEERFARVSLRSLGVDDALAPSLIVRSRELVSETRIPEPKIRKPRWTRSATSLVVMSEHHSFASPCQFSKARHKEIRRDVGVGNARRIVPTEVGDAVGGEHLIIDEKLSRHNLCI